MGYENLFFAYKDEPELIHDIQETFTQLWLAVYAEVLADVEIDALHVWEDISAGSGSMVAPGTMREFMVPYYQRLTSFVKDRGVDVVLVDTDGDCSGIIPVFVEGGVTGLYPFEVSCGIDIVEVRRNFPRLQMLGGVPKGELHRGKPAIDKLLEPVAEVLKTGGYVPFVDHLVPPDVDWENFQYYRTRLNQIIDGFGD
jgi:uroporphyrinogen-III decarboxylase